LRHYNNEGNGTGSITDKKVLIVEDNKINMLLAKTLVKNNFKLYNLSGYGRK
jgi:hypothetical protein